MKIHIIACVILLTDRKTDRQIEVKTVLLPKVAEVTIDINNSGVMDIQFKTFSHTVQMLVTLN